ncbi:ATP-binding protein [Niabella aquatica]
MMLSLNKIRFGYALSSLLLLVSYVLIFSTNRQLQHEKNWIVNNYTLINKMGDIKMMMGTAESSVRGYIINKQPRFLNSFYEARSDIAMAHAEIRNLTKADTVQSANESELKAMTDRRLSELSTALLPHQKTPLTLKESTVNPAKLAQTDSIYKQILKMTDLEKQLMKKRISKLNSFYSSTEAVTIWSLCMAVIAVLYAVITFNSQYQQKRKANDTADQYRKRLESNVQELSEKNTELNELKGIEKLAAIGRVARVVAHEVRNPLTNIALAAEQLQDIPCFEKEEEAGSLMKIINRNSVRISQMVADLLNATKFMQLNKQEEDINKILDESLEMAKDRLMLKRMHVVKNYSDDICGIMVDKERIKVAFLNIIVNAIEAMEEVEGILGLSTRKEGKKCIIEIKDNGKGMDEYTVQNLFEPYFTLKKKGNGLGLTNAQNIIVSHKGIIKVNSKVGEGSTFIISLNIA